MSGLCKYYKVVRQVSYDSGVTWVNIGETRKGDLYEYNSPACGAVTEYRWVDVTGQYTCDGTTKYQKTKRQYSEDGGQTWSDVSPAEYGKGDVIEYASSDCGYVPPTPVGCDDYLTFVTQESGTFRFSGTSGNDSISYSIDNGSTWYTLARNTDSPSIQSGSKIIWKGNLIPQRTPSALTDGIGRFSSTGRFNVEGNAMSLLYGDNFAGKTSLSGNDYAFSGLFWGCTKLINANNFCLPATTLSRACYAGMFYGCTSLLTAPNLPATTLASHCYNGMFMKCTSLTTTPVLPATTLADNCYYYMFEECSSLTTVSQLPATTLEYWCYGGMFKRCTSLATAPSLPATALTDYCYYEMLEDCTSLTTAPELPATTLKERCYSDMFRGCTSLTTAPDLPAPTLVKRCYYGMFERCGSLSYIKCLATNISASECTYLWVKGVASSGTFVKASSMNSWTTGTSGIPNNWTVQNA